ncbi:hypothetical protein ACE106_07285 [Shouchella clausii]|uniref:hypothetical protein n=1 Tax=Shouchella clausii TaxID=79880 RepID=UPI0028978B0C|nr:hypothetical protein [Shouchella clausii]
MKIKYDLLYKSGAKDSIVQEDMTIEKAEKFHGLIFQALQHDNLSGYLTFGKDTAAYVVRVSSIDRVVITILGTGADNEKR